MVKAIALIGLGGIGRRHFESLLKLDPTRHVIYAVDIDVSANVLLKELTQKSGWDFGSNVFFYNDSKLLPECIDICIVASTSIHRLGIIKDVLQTCKVEFWILEKVLFSELADYPKAETLLNNSSTRTWVNCSRRMWKGYQQLMSSINGSESLNVSYSGMDWGMACNSIHFIDLCCYLSNAQPQFFEFDTGALESRIFDSKRSGFVEVFGTLKILTPSFQLTIHNERTPHHDQGKVKIESSRFSAEIDEGANLVKLDDGNQFSLGMEYQSNLTHIAASQILKTSQCDLTPFCFSSQMHQSFLSALYRFFDNLPSAKTGTKWLIT
jgi:hypothetical protein